MLLLASNVPALSLPPQSSRGGHDGGDDVAILRDEEHVNHPGKFLLAIVDSGEDEPSYLCLVQPGVRDPGAIKFYFLSSPPQYTCSSLDDDAVVLLLLVEGPGVVTGGEGDGDQACFF